MKILAVDDERLALNNLTARLKEVLPEALVTSFTKSAEALEWLSNNDVEIAFLDIEIVGMDGLSLAKRCKDIRPNINIIFVTGYDQYAIEALQLHASGYLIKPVRPKDLKVELENLRYPLLSCVDMRVRIQTFGNFEVFVDKKPLHMPITKCRECLAYLIDRKGARVMTAELAAVLWEDEPYDKRVQNKTYRVITEMIKRLHEAGISSIVIKSRQYVAINTEEIDCDYYRFLRGDVSQINAFHGEYMSNYSWAEFTLSELLQIRDGN